MGEDKTRNIKILENAWKLNFFVIFFINHVIYSFNIFILSVLEFLKTIQDFVPNLFMCCCTSWAENKEESAKRTHIVFIFFSSFSFFLLHIGNIFGKYVINVA